MTTESSTIVWGAPTGAVSPSVWPRELDAAADDVTRTCRGVCDPAKDGGATAVLFSWLNQRQSIEEDTDLSPEGQASRLAHADEKAWAALPGAVRSFNTAAAMHASALATALAKVVPTTDAAGVQVDLALAAQFRDKPMAQPEKSASRRMREALARLPTELTGVDEDAHQRIAHSLLEQSDLARFERHQKALSHARVALQKAIGLIAPKMPGGATQKRLHLGAGDEFRI